MIRKYHNHKLQINPWHREEEPHNQHETPGRQTKQNNLLSLPNQDDCKNNDPHVIYNLKLGHVVFKADHVCTFIEIGLAWCLFYSFSLNVILNIYTQTKKLCPLDVYVCQFQMYERISFKYSPYKLI